MTALESGSVWAGAADAALLAGANASERYGVLIDQAAVVVQLALPGMEPERLYHCARCDSWLPAGSFYPRYAMQRRGPRNNRFGGSGYCRRCHNEEGAGR